MDLFNNYHLGIFGDEVVLSSGCKRCFRDYLINVALLAISLPLVPVIFFIPFLLVYVIAGVNIGILYYFAMYYMLAATFSFLAVATFSRPVIETRIDLRENRILLKKVTLFGVREIASSLDNVKYAWFKLDRDKNLVNIFVEMKNGKVEKLGSGKIEIVEFLEYLSQRDFVEDASLNHGLENDFLSGKPIRVYSKRNWILAYFFSILYLAIYSMVLIGLIFIEENITTHGLYIISFIAISSMIVLYIFWRGAKRPFMEIIYRGNKLEIVHLPENKIFVVEISNIEKFWVGEGKIKTYLGEEKGIAIIINKEGDYSTITIPKDLISLFIKVLKKI